MGTGMAGDGFWWLILIRWGRGFETNGTQVVHKSGGERTQGGTCQRPHAHRLAGRRARRKGKAGRKAGRAGAGRQAGGHRARRK